MNNNTIIFYTILLTDNDGNCLIYKDFYINIINIWFAISNEPSINISSFDSTIPLPFW